MPIEMRNGEMTSELQSMIHRALADSPQMTGLPSEFKFSARAMLAAYNGFMARQPVPGPTMIDGVESPDFLGAAMASLSPGERETLQRTGMLARKKAGTFSAAEAVSRVVPKANPNTANMSMQAEYKRLVAIETTAKQEVEIKANTEAVRAMVERQRLAECIHASTRLDRRVR